MFSGMWEEAGLPRENPHRKAPAEPLSERKRLSPPHHCAASNHSIMIIIRRDKNNPVSFPPCVKHFHLKGRAAIMLSTNYSVFIGSGRQNEEAQPTEKCIILYCLTIIHWRVVDIYILFIS